jgi:hypothetical protein
MKTGFLKSLADSKKIKYSTISTAFIAIVIAIVIMLNAISTVLSEKFGWYIDMTDEQMFSLSDDAKKLLDTINDEVQLEIVFPYDKDEIDTNYANTKTTGAIGYVHSTAEQILKACDNVTVSYHDVDKDYLFYKEAGVLGKAGDDKILILRKDTNGKYVEGDFRVYPVNYFFVGDTSGNLYGYNGELMFLSALLAMSHDTVPVVYFTIGHSEQSFNDDVSISYETINEAFVAGKINEKALELMRVFCDSGFVVKPLDLVTSEIPDDARIVVINQPNSDFDDGEIYKLTTYLEKEGTVFCFTPHSVNLPNLYTALETNYGIAIRPNATPVEDTSTQFANTKYTLLANVSTTDNSFATKQYFGSLNSFASARARLMNCATLDIDEKFMTTEGYQTGSIIRYTYPLLETTRNAVYGDSKGIYNLMAVSSREQWSYEGQYSSFSYLVVCPSSDFASNEYLTSTSAPNKNMILSLIQSTSSVQTPVNLEYKTFMTYELDITDRQAQSATVLLATIVPALVVLCGVVIMVRRKHK